jgi:hypothetical protein
MVEAGKSVGTSQFEKIIYHRKVSYGINSTHILRKYVLGLRNHGCGGLPATSWATSSGRIRRVAVEVCLGISLNVIVRSRAIFRLNPPSPFALQPYTPTHKHAIGPSHVAVYVLAGPCPAHPRAAVAHHLPGARTVSRQLAPSCSSGRPSQEDPAYQRMGRPCSNCPADQSRQRYRLRGVHCPTHA